VTTVISRSRKGLILAVIVAVLPLISLSVMALGARSVETLHVAARNAYEMQAYYAADAGVQAALARLKLDSEWTDGFRGQALPGLDDRSYSVTVTNGNVGTPPVLAPDGRTVLPYEVDILSTGTATASTTEQVRVQARRGTVFTKAVFGYDGVRIGGVAQVAAYDSAAGAYTPHAPQMDVEVGTNSTSAGAVTVFGASRVDGNASVGPGGDPSTAVVDTGHLTGTAYASEQEFPLRDVTCPIDGSGADQFNPASLAPGVYGGLTVTPQKTCTLGSGIYRFQGNVRIGGTLRVEPTDGPCVIYVDGSWDSSAGSVVNTSLQSYDLQIYGTSTCTSVSLSGGTEACFVVYAPGADITMTGTADIYGSLIGRTVSLIGTGNLHYDVQLANSGIGPAFWSVLSYQRD